MLKVHAVQIVITRRWWVTPYIRTLAGLCALMGTEPDLAKAGAFMAKYGFKYSVKSKEVE
jgi:hypothetical protein